MKKIKILIAVAVTVVSFVLQASPLRIAVYVDNGARNTGVFRWLELTTRAKNVVTTPVDAEAIRKGALDAADVLIMPGGSSVLEAKTLGPVGREKVKAFVKNGGGYIGTCAGCCLLMQSSKCHPNMLNMIPYTFSVTGGATDMSIMFNQRAKDLTGIRKGKQNVRYSAGPVLVPSQPVQDAEVEVVAYYNSDINLKSDKERLSMAGQTAAVAGTYGKGKIFAIAVHPEYDYDDHYILRGAFRYVSGREIEWDAPQRKRGQLAVGIMCDNSFGVETSRLIQRLLTECEFDIIALNKRLIGSGYLRHVDAVLSPPTVGAAKAGSGLYDGNAERTKDFIARGGRIFAWGSAAAAAKECGSSEICVDEAEAALAQLRAFAAEPASALAAIPPKVEKPIRVGIFQNENNSNIIIARMLALAPEFELKLLSPEEYANGALNGLDLVIQPGGGCTSQYKALGEKGAEALKNFVRTGGKYYGVCAGAFLALQQSREGYPRLGLVPFKGDDPAHYRGKAPIKVALTEEGKKVFEGSDAERNVIYAGGPAAIPAESVEDTDVVVLGKYFGRTISVTNPDPVEPMTGKAAFLGGRVSKGKVFLSCPHPEFEEAAHDMVRSGIKYLTGVAPSPVYLNRTRGAMSVKFCSSDKASVEFLFGTLERDSRFYVWSGKGLESLSHMDAVVLTDKVTKEDIKTLEYSIARGVKVVVVADTKEKRKAAENFKNAVVVDSYSKVVDAILAE